MGEKQYLRKRIEIFRQKAKSYKKKKNEMKVGKIDKDLVDIIAALNEAGFKPFASCDGVEAHHIHFDPRQEAYIAFLESPRIDELMAALLRDKETFDVVFQNHTCVNPYYLYGNLIHGNRYIVYFKNRYGERTSYFKKIINGIVNKNINITKEEKEFVRKLSMMLRSEKKSDLNFDLQLNTTYPNYMKKDGMTSILRITTKDGLDYYKDMQQLAQILSDKKGIACKQEMGEEYNEDIFSLCMDNSACDIYFKSEKTEDILSLIKYIAKKGKNLSACEFSEQEYEGEEIENDFVI